MEYELQDEESGSEREPIKPAYIWVPALVSFLVIVFTIILKATEKTPDGFMSWGVVIIVIVMTLILTFGLSIVLYMFLGLKDVSPQGRKFNSRGKCDDLLRKELRRRTGYNLDDFSETGDSIEGVKMAGAGKEQDKFYYHLYRIKKGQLKRFLIGVVNMEQGKEDDVTLKQSPMNFQELEKTISDIANSMCSNPERIVTREKVYRDEVSGRSQVEREQSPFDLPENGEEEEVVQ